MALSGVSIHLLWPLMLDQFDHLVFVAFNYFLFFN